MRPNVPELKTLRKSVGVGLQSKCRLQDIADALIANGYTSLDKQAKALGIHRATAWTIITRKHKLGRLNTRTIERILANPELPSSVRSVIEQDLAGTARRRAERQNQQIVGWKSQDTAERKR
jgi:hypothetical protein